MSEPTLRTFVALELPPAARELIASAQARLREEAGRWEQLIRWVDPSTAHLTLKFLGATPESRVEEIVTALEIAAAGGGALELGATQLGCFPSGRSPRVLWLGLAGDLERLAALRDAVESHVAPLGWPAEERPFRPHLTLGRVRAEASHAERAGIGRAVGAIWPAAGERFQVGEVSLMQSQLSPAGALYTPLHRVTL